jgi:hypothetical protein
VWDPLKEGNDPRRRCRGEYDTGVMDQPDSPALTVRHGFNLLCGSGF